MGVVFGPLTVEARDAQANVAPHKIGAHPAKDSLEWFFALGQDGDIWPDDGFIPDDSNSGLKFGDVHVVGTIHRLGGTDASTGEIIGGDGYACSDQIACSELLACGEVDLVTGTVAGFVWSGAAALAGDADGEYAVRTYLQVEGKGWV